MMNQLVRLGEAFPNGLWVAIGLLLCLSADGASGAPARKPAGPTDCASAANKNIPPCALETGKVTVFWPKRGLTDKLARTFNSKIEVWIDKVKAGIVLGDVPLVLSLPNGPHKLELKVHDDYLENIRPIRETEITVSAQQPLYFQIVDQGVSIVARELDAPTAQAILFKPNAYPSLAVPGSDMKTPTGDGTLYVYWPKPTLGLGFLDKYSTDMPVLLDGKRVGAAKLGEYLVLKTPPGEHTLEVDAGSLRSGRNKEGFIIGAGGTRYFRIENQDAVRMFEDSAEEAAVYAKGLGFVVAASELNAPPAQAVLPVNVPSAATPQAVLPVNVPSTATPQAVFPVNAPSAATPQAPVAALSAKEPKGKPNASPSLAASTAAAGNATITPSASGTVYLYWPKPFGFGFLDQYATDLPVFLNGKRIGAVKMGEYLAFKIPPGEHALGLDAGLPGGRLVKRDFILGAGSTTHFHVEHQDAVRMVEDSPEEAADNAKGLKQRDVAVQ
jgi:hypothetical protein